MDRRRLDERVWIWNGQWKRAFGTAAEYIALPAAQAVPLPDGTGFEAGACLGIPALTAWRAVETDGGVTGHGAGGGRRRRGRALRHPDGEAARRARVIATVSSVAKAAHARAAGADEVIDYRVEKVAERVPT